MMMFISINHAYFAPRRENGRLKLIYLGRGDHLMLIMNGRRLKLDGRVKLCNTIRLPASRFVGSRSYNKIFSWNRLSAEKRNPHSLLPSYCSREYFMPASRLEKRGGRPRNQFPSFRERNRRRCYLLQRIFLHFGVRGMC